jgi:hypothetical protein
MLALAYARKKVKSRRESRVDMVVDRFVPTQSGWLAFYSSCIKSSRMEWNENREKITP